MNQQLQTTLIAAFDDRFEAERAVKDLEAAGFGADQVGYVIRGDDATQGGMITDATGAKDARGAVAGAATGAVVGGVLAAAAALILPGIGPVIAGGILTSFFGGAIAGTAVGGILGAMKGLGISEHEAHQYERLFHEGKAIIAIKPEGHEEVAASIIRLHGGYNLRERLGSPFPTEGTFSEP